MSKRKKRYFCPELFKETMKNLVIGFCLLGILASCGDGKKKTDPFIALTEQIDSINNVETDSVTSDSYAEEEEIPIAADESFADFFYNFASDEAFQRSRIIFPLPLYEEKHVTRIEKTKWKYDPIFSKEAAYTTIFDKEEDMEVEKDTALRSVQIDWIYLAENKIKRYYFERKDNQWVLEAINKIKTAYKVKNKEAENFYAFYERFSQDSVFQRQRLRRPLAFVTSDPEDEFQILETTLDEGQWFTFRPPIMKARLTNVHYGQPEATDSKYKIVEYKGFGNGFSNVLYFERKGGVWKLTKFEDLSD